MEIKYEISETKNKDENAKDEKVLNKKTEIENIKDISEDDFVLDRKDLKAKNPPTKAFSNHFTCELKYGDIIYYCTCGLSQNQVNLII